jgi:hypothetical protein
MSNRDETQQKAFLRWTNIVLSKHPSELPPVENLIDAIQDGLTLGHLAEAVIPTKLKLSPPKNDLTRVQNISLALSSFESSGCKLVNIHSSAISRGDKKTILGLMFQLCIHYQVQSSSASEDGKALTVVQLKQQLIQWVNEVLTALKPEDNLSIRVSNDIYSEEPLRCKDLDKSLVDGTILMGLISVLCMQHGQKIISQMNSDIDFLLDEFVHVNSPTRVKQFQKKNQSQEENSKKCKILFDRFADKKLTTTQQQNIVAVFIAMQTAQQVLDIPALMDPEDMVLNGDSSANLAYLSYFHNIDPDPETLNIGKSEQTDINLDLLKSDLNIAPVLPPNVVTLQSFDPDKEYDDDIILFL